MVNLTSFYPYYARLGPFGPFKTISDKKRFFAPKLEGQNACCVIWAKISFVQNGVEGLKWTTADLPGYRDITLFGEVEVPVKALMNCLPISIT